MASPVFGELAKSSEIHADPVEPRRAQCRSVAFQATALSGNPTRRGLRKTRERRITSTADCSASTTGKTER